MRFAPVFTLSFFLMSSVTLAQKNQKTVPELTKEYRKHCHSLSMTDFTPYAEQLDLVRRKKFICRKTFSYPESDMKDSKARYAIRNYLDNQEPGTSEEWVQSVPDVLDSYSYQDSEIEKLQIVLNVFERFMYQDSKEAGPYTIALLSQPNLSALTSKNFLSGRSAYHDGQAKRDFGRVDLALAYAAFHSIDRARLFNEMAAWKIDTPAYKRVVGKWLDLSLLVVQKMDTMAATMKSRSPASAGLFSNTLQVYKDALAEAKEQSKVFQLQETLIQQLIKGQSPSPAQCDIPLLTNFTNNVGKVWKHGLVNPMTARTLALAETCLAFRDNSLRQLVHAMAAKEQALSPFSAAALFAQKNDLAMVNDLGATVKINLTYTSYYKTFLPSMVQNRPVFLLPNHGPTGDYKQHPNLLEGAIRIVDIKKVKIAGHEYLLVGGKGKKVKTPNWNCTLRKTGGWVISGNQIRARTSRNCKITGYSMIEPIDYQPMLVPKILGKKIRKGSWYKFLRVANLDYTLTSMSNYKSNMINRQGVYTSDALKKEQLSILKKTSAMSKKNKLLHISEQIRSESDLRQLRYAIPICVSKKPEKCASLGTEGDAFVATAPGAFSVF